VGYPVLDPLLVVHQTYSKSLYNTFTLLERIIYFLQGTLDFAGFQNSIYKSYKKSLNFTNVYKVLISVI